MFNCWALILQNYTISMQKKIETKYFIIFAPPRLSIVASKLMRTFIVKTLYNIMAEKPKLYYISIYWLSKLQHYKLIFAPLRLSIFCPNEYINSPQLISIMCWKIYVVNDCNLASVCLLRGFCSANLTMSKNRCIIYLVEPKFFTFSKKLNLMLLLRFSNNEKNIFQLQDPQIIILI